MLANPENPFDAKHWNISDRYANTTTILTDIGQPNSHNDNIAKRLRITEVFVSELS